MKITDDGYRLPYIEAIASFGVMESGTTKPMAIRGIDQQSGEVGKFVVKFIKGHRMTGASSCRELLGCWIAKQLDIKVIEAVVVNISGDFANTIIGEPGYQATLKSIGYNFGSIYEEGYSEFPNRYFAPDGNMLEQMKLVFMFDMFIANADRGAGKPNILSNGKDLLLLDHELAFSFVDILSFLRTKTPWIFSNAEKELYQRHYLYPFLQGQDVDFDKICEKLQNIDESFWERVSQLMPLEWGDFKLNEIQSQLNAITSHHQIFSTELNKILLS